MSTPNQISNRQVVIQGLFEKLGDIATLGNTHNLPPWKLRRYGLGALAAIGLGVGAAGSVAAAESSAPAPAAHFAVVYPRRTEAQLRGLPAEDQAHLKVTYPGEGADALIEKANPGILDSTNLGAERTVRELEDIVASQVPAGELQYPSNQQITVPEVPTAVQEVR